MTDLDTFPADSCSGDPASAAPAGELASELLSGAVPPAGEPATESAGEPAEAGQEALIEAMRRLEARVSAETEKVLKAFRDKLAFDGFKEEQVARLHAELQEHRDGLLEQATRPLLNAVIRVHDDLGKVVASLRARPAEEITPDRAFRALDGFREDLELLLSQHGVEPFEPVDDVFDPRVHTALRTVHCDEPDRAGRIAERLRPGFSQGGALLQKARVAVYTAQGARAPAPHEGPSTAAPSTATGELG
jgi:molecular chaperone GrpE